MIRINLLPAELRRGNRIPPKVVATAFAAALAVSAAVGWFGLVYFGDLGAAERALEEAQAKLSDKQKKVGYHDQLQANRQDYGERVQTIQEIGKSRRLWSKFTDELIDVVNNDGDDVRHVAWFDSLTVKNDPKKGATVTMPGQVQGSDKSRLANLHEDIENSPIAKELSGKSDPTFKLDTEKDRVPPESLMFPLQLQLKPTVVDEKAQKATKPQAKKPAGK